MKTAALIPAKKHSNGVPGKNTEKEFCGKLLWQWTFEQAKASGVFDMVILSTDNPDYERFKDYDPILTVDWNRPDHLCQQASNDDVIIHYAQKYPDVECWSLLQLTSPLRTAEDIKSAYAMLDEEWKDGTKKYDSIISVFNHPILGWVANSAYHKGRKYHTALFHTHKRPNRQDRQDWYLENGAVYFVTTEALKLTGSRIGATPGLYVMPKERSFEIDDETDWKICEMMMADETYRANLKKARETSVRVPS